MPACQQCCCAVARLKCLGLFGVLPAATSALKGLHHVPECAASIVTMHTLSDMIIYVGNEEEEELHLFQPMPG